LAVYFLVMAMPVQHLKIVFVITSSQPSRENVIDFQDIPLPDEQTAKATLPCLISQEAANLVPGQGMVFKSLRPIDEIAIIRTSTSLHLHVALDRCGSMSPKGDAFLVFEPPAFALVHCPVFVYHPSSVLVGVSGACPVAEHLIELVVTIGIYFFGYSRAV